MSEPQQQLLLDTCAAIWLATNQPLSRRVVDLIQAARKEGRDIFVSPFTAWEVAMLASRGRFVVKVSPKDWFTSLMQLPGLRLAPLTPDILIASTKLPGAPPRDPADRIIAATARALGLTVVTRDGELLPYAAAGHLAAVRC